MRARKITVMLAMVAISALTMFLLTLPSCAEAAELPGGRVSVPDTLASYAETVLVGPDGDDTVEIVVVAGRGDFRDLLVPFDFDGGTDISVLSGPAVLGRDDQGHEVPIITVLGQRFLNLRAPQAVAGDTIRVRATIAGWFEASSSSRPFGETRVTRHFVNTSDFVLGDMRMALILPGGERVHAVEKVVPAYDPKKSPEPPFSITRMQEREHVSLRRSWLSRSEVLELGVTIRPARRGPLVLVVGVVLAALYLIAFRDVLKPKPEA